MQPYILLGQRPIKGIVTKSDQVRYTMNGTTKRRKKSLKLQKVQKSKPQPSKETTAVTHPNMNHHSREDTDKGQNETQCEDSFNSQKKKKKNKNLRKTNKNKEQIIGIWRDGEGRRVSVREDLVSAKTASGERTTTRVGGSGEKQQRRRQEVAHRVEDQVQLSLNQINECCQGSYYFYNKPLTS